MRPDVYSRPKKPKTIPVTKRTVENLAEISFQPVTTVHATTECHVTPPNIAYRMAEYLLDNIFMNGAKILDPSSGTGNLILALKQFGKDKSDIVAIEQNTHLCDVTNNRAGVKPICINFLEYNPLRLFYGIIMNPPFKNYKKHINKAIECLMPGGCIVAIVPITFQHKNAETIEILPRDTFATCNVSTKIIRIS